MIECAHKRSADRRSITKLRQTHPAAITCWNRRPLCIASKKSNCGLSLAAVRQRVIKCGVGHPLSLWKKHNQPKSRAAIDQPRCCGAPLWKLEIMFPFQQVLKSTGWNSNLCKKASGAFFSVLFISECVFLRRCVINLIKLLYWERINVNNDPVSLSVRACALVCLYEWKATRLVALPREHALLGRVARARERARSLAKTYAVTVQRRL